MLIVKALGQLEHSGGSSRALGAGLAGGDGRHGHGRLCLDRRYGGSGGRGQGSSLAELGHSAVSGLELGLEVGVLGLQLTHRLDYLVEELVDLVLLVALTELGRLELLVEDVVCCQQRHGSSPRCRYG